MAQNNQPIASKQAKKLIAHNHTRIDDYYWMNERDSKPVLDYISLENKYAEEYFAPLNGMVDGLMKEFDQRINPNEISAPFILN
jgi:oligopeptidase B